MTREELTNYHFMKAFCEKVLTKLGEYEYDALRMEVYKDTEARHENKREMMIANGWTELERGVYSAPMPRADRNSESYKEMQKKFEEFKEQKRLQRGEK